MSERTDRDESLLAFQYAAGELDEAASVEFESRLADEQGARDALCAAVKTTREAAGSSDISPDPAYRNRVRDRLRTIGAFRPRSSRFGVRNASVWACAGVAAALLLWMALGSQSHIGDNREAVPSTSIEAEPLARGVAEDCGEDGDMLPGLMSGGRLAQAVHDENLRKYRAEARRVVSMEDRASRLRGSPVIRQ
jgi:hypothetical protein